MMHNKNTFQCHKKSSALGLFHSFRGRRSATGAFSSLKRNNRNALTSKRLKNPYMPYSLNTRKPGARGPHQNRKQTDSDWSWMPFLTKDLQSSLWNLHCCSPQHSLNFSVNLYLYKPLKNRKLYLKSTCKIYTLLQKPLSSWIPPNLQTKDGCSESESTRFISVWCIHKTKIYLILRG